MKTAAERKADNYRSFVLVGFAMGLVFLAAAFLPIWHPRVRIEKCPFDSAGNVIPDRTADGALTALAGIYFVHRDGVEDSIVGSCAKGSPTCTRLLSQVERYVGEPVHVEYCGRTVSSVTVPGNRVFRSPPVTEASIDRQATWDRHFALWIAGVSLLVGGLSLLKLRLIRREADYTVR